MAEDEESTCLTAAHVGRADADAEFDNYPHQDLEEARKDLDEWRVALRELQDHSADSFWVTTADYWVGFFERIIELKETTP